MIRHTSSALAAVGVLFIGATPASASTPLSVNPSKPVVDAAVTVSFKVAKRLPAGWHYSFSIIAPSGDDCSSFVFKTATRRPTVGKRMSMKLSPHDDLVNGGSKWCPGKTTILVGMERNGIDDESDASASREVGSKRIRFSG